MDFVNSTTGYSVSGWGIVLKTTNTGNSWFQTEYITSEHLEDITFVNSNKGYIVGNHGLILSTSDAGQSWNPVNSGTDKWLNSVFFVNENAGWIVGSEGVNSKIFKLTQNVFEGHTTINVCPSLSFLFNPSIKLYL